MTLLIELPTFLEVVSSGPGGLIVFAIFVAVVLFSLEQRRPEPRKSIMNFIIGLVVLCLLGAVLMLFINKSKNEDSYVKLMTQLRALCSDQGTFAESFIIDNDGDPKNPKFVISKKDSIDLAKFMTTESLKNKERKFIPHGDSLYITTENGTFLGYINLKDLEDLQHVNDIEIKSEDLLFASQKRGAIPYDIIKAELPYNVKQAATYLIKILNESNHGIKTKAGKALVHHEILSELSEDQFYNLINYLESNDRKKPFCHFELAQVYTVLAANHKWFNNAESKRDSCYEEYITWYNSPSNRQFYNRNSKTTSLLVAWDSIAHYNTGKDWVRK